MDIIKSKEEWMEKKRKQRKRMTVAVILLSLSILGVMLAILITRVDTPQIHSKRESISPTLSNGVIIKEQYLTPNDFSRPQTPLKKVKGIVIHYTANPGTSAIANRNYFEGLATRNTTFASSHYIVGLDGEVVQCIPLTEIAYASNQRNVDTIAIEVCHEDETGVFSKKTYGSLVSLVAALCIEFDLEDKDIIRHYDITGKNCPKYYVENEDAWLMLKEDIVKEMIWMNHVNTNN